MCQVLQVSRSGYYAWCRRPPSAQACRRAQRATQVEQAFHDSGGRYGSGKITAVLRRAGERIAQKTVAQLMQALGLRSRVMRKYKATTNSHHRYPVADNRLNQHFVADQIHTTWMGDITYIATDEGWLYLATLEDWYSRQIVGWAMDARMTKELVIRALDQAVDRHHPPQGVLHHSDRVFLLSLFVMTVTQYFGCFCKFLGTFWVFVSGSINGFLFSMENFDIIDTRVGDMRFSRMFAIE